VPAAPATANPASAASASPSAAPLSRASAPVLWNCEGKAVIEPSNYIVTCADDGINFDMHWSSWGRESATGSGTVHEKNCLPSCADGKIIEYPAEVTLTGRKWWPRVGRDSYAEITVHYPDAAPAVYVMVKGKLVATYPHTVTFTPGGPQ
jgi:hypothetical protein